jgi:hypothetical protein
MRVTVGSVSKSCMKLLDEIVIWGRAMLVTGWYRKLPLENTGGILCKRTRWDGSCNSPLGFLAVAHDILNFEINDSQRVTRWKVKEKIKKNTYFGEYKNSKNYFQIFE